MVLSYQLGLKHDKGEMLPDKANYGAVDLVIKQRDDQVCETLVDCLLTNIPAGKTADLMGWSGHAEEGPVFEGPGSVKWGGVGESSWRQLLGS